MTRGEGKFDGENRERIVTMAISWERAGQFGVKKREIDELRALVKSELGMSSIPNLNLRGLLTQETDDYVLQNLVGSSFGKPIVKVRNVQYNSLGIQITFRFVQGMLSNQLQQMKRDPDFKSDT